MLPPSGKKLRKNYRWFNNKLHNICRIALDHISARDEAAVQAADRGERSTSARAGERSLAGAVCKRRPKWAIMGPTIHKFRRDLAIGARVPRRRC